MKNGYSEQESLARSHSASSNAKLTLIVLLGAIFFALTFACLGLYLAKDVSVCLYGAIGCGVLAVLDFFGITRFRR